MQYQRSASHEAGQAGLLTSELYDRGRPNIVPGRASGVRSLTAIKSAVPRNDIGAEKPNARHHFWPVMLTACLRPYHSETANTPRPRKISELHHYK